MQGVFVRGQVTFEFIITVVIILGIFVAGLAIFEDRQSMNFSFSQKWVVQNIAFRMARDIDNAYLLDDNAVITDVVYFSNPNVNFAINGNSLVFHGGSFFVDAPLSTSNVSFLVTDFNGNIFFRKTSGGVVVGYS